MATIPLIIDSVGDDGLTRGIYFQIEGEESPHIWTLGLETARIPFFMLGLSGVIVGPLDWREGATFTNPNQLELLIETLESNEDPTLVQSFHVESADLWLPTKWLKHRNELPKRHDAWRISEALFQIAIGVRYGRLSPGQLFDVQPNDNTLFPSRQETDLFRSWAETQINRSRNQVNPEYLLDDGEEGLRG